MPHNDVLEKLFPRLKETGYEETSSRSTLYNCIAWAVGEDTVKWDPSPGYYWPRRVPRNSRVESVVLAFRSIGFNVCHDAELVNGLEKLAIYALGDQFTHVARQLADGNWTSKIGQLEDIEHTSLDGLVGDEYGQVIRIMQRPRS